MLNTRGSEVLSLCDFVLQQCASTREQESPGPGLPGPHPHPGGRPLPAREQPFPAGQQPVLPLVAARGTDADPWQVHRAISWAASCEDSVKLQPQAPREPPAPCPPCHPLCHPWGTPQRSLPLTQPSTQRLSPAPGPGGGGRTQPLLCTFTPLEG